MKYLYFLFLITFISCEKKSERKSELDKFTSEFFEKYKSNIPDAMNFMYSSNKYVANNKDAIDSANNKLISLTRVLGEYHGSEFITERSIANSLILRSYLIKYDRQPIRFTFIFYKAKSDLVIYNFHYDLDVDSELKNSAQIQFMNEIYPESEWLVPIYTSLKKCFKFLIKL